MTNAEIIRRLRRAAAESARKGGNLYRIRALRQAALRMSALPGELAELGPEALRSTGLGKKLAKEVYGWAVSAVETADAASP